MSRTATLAILLVANVSLADETREEVAPHRRERVTCSIAAAEKFGIPANIMLAVAEMEGGRPGQRVKNRNGSHDVGPMQFNTRYLDHLKERYGITAEDVGAPGCYPYDLAAWRLRKHIELDKGDIWTKVANYHSRSPAHNAKYRRKLIAKAAAWACRLSDRRPTISAASASKCEHDFGQRSRRHRAATQQSYGAREVLPEIADVDSDIEVLLRLLDDDDDEAPPIVLPRERDSVGRISL